MLDDVFLSELLNICLLMALAYVIGKWGLIKQILQQRSRGEKSPGERKKELLKKKIELGLTLGVFCMVSNTVGFMVNGSIPNARVIGAMSAGMLGGPVSGFLAAGIGAFHRYLGEPERISTMGCVTATVIQGGLGSLFWYIRRQKIDYSAVFLYVSTFLAEAMHMLLIYLMSWPKDEALSIIRTIAGPMVFMNPIGMILFFFVIRDAIRQADREEAAGVSRSLRITERCAPWLHVGGDLDINIQKVLEIIVEEAECEGAAFVRNNDFLARTEAFRDVTLSEEEIQAALSLCQRTGEAVTIQDTASFAGLDGKYVVIAAEVTAFLSHRDYLVVLIGKSVYSSETDYSYVGGLARFITIQLTQSLLEEQKNLRKRAELQTLQSQINPHFLFNALNTISFFCREKPEKARELLLALSTYFRNTLQDVDAMVTLGEELEHVKAYLMLEEARFEDRLQVEIDAREEALDVMVPNLILQPLVENAVRHGAMTQAEGHVRIRIRRRGDSAVIEVCDNGPGVPENVIWAIERGVAVGDGIGLLNVQKRLMGRWGRSAGLLFSHEDGWTRIHTEIPDERRRKAS